MLKRENRLKKHYQYAYVYHAGVKASGKALTLYATSSKTKHIKVGFSVTKKIGKATVRNLTRRRLREIIRKQIPNLKQNYNIIVVAKDNILSFSYAELESDLSKLLAKLDLVKNNEKDI